MDMTTTPRPEMTHNPHQPCNQTPECYWCATARWQRGEGKITAAAYQMEQRRILRDLHNEVCADAVCVGYCNAYDWAGRIVTDLILLGAAAGRSGIVPSRPEGEEEKGGDRG